MSRRPHWSWACLVLMLGAATLVMYLEARGMTFRRDDWNMILTRRGHSLEVFLRPHSGHLLPLHVLAYKGLLETFGLRSYVPYQALAFGLHALVATLLFVYARARVGPLAALAVTAVFVIPGAAVHDVLWPFQIGFLTSLAAGLGMLLALERDDGRGDAAASGLLLVAIVSSAVGLAIAAGAVVELVALRARRRRFARVLAVPLGLFGLWYVLYAGEVPPGTAPATEPDLAQPLIDNLLDAPRYVFDTAGAALSNTVGLGPSVGPVLALAATVLVGHRLVSGRVLSTRLRTVLALAVTYWGLLALARAQLNDPAQVRYLYPSVLFVLLVVVEWARGLRLARPGHAVLALATTAIVLINIGQLRNEADILLRDASDILPRLTALELSRGSVAADFRPSPPPHGSAPDVVAGAYFAAIDDFGSPAPSPDELLRAPEELRAVADATLLQANGIRISTGAGGRAGGPPPTVIAVEGAQAQTRGGCVALAPATFPASVEVRADGPGLALEIEAGGAVNLHARRLADGFVGPPFATLAGDQRAVLELPDARLARPWHVKVEAGQRVRVCGLAG